ncbi:MAG: acyl-CoA synthetase FdrA [Anaerolineales bacterium]|nr:acyl-CoA synthetase FdrA [Anaerolineales bacterium]
MALADEIELKRTAAEQGLLVMGPDCGTAIVSGAGLGFANRVRRGSIGLVSASGTGLQLVTARIHQLGGGVSHAFGAGGRDLSEAVGAVTTRQSLALLAADPATQVIVIISKPPAPSVAENLIRIARAAGKPVVIDFIGYRPVEQMQGNVYFAPTLDGAANLAVELAAFEDARPLVKERGFAPGQRYLRGVFSGGTLAYEAQLLLADYLPAVYSNAPLDKKFKLARATESHEHTIVDLGEDEFTVGRLHPMMDNDLRIKRILQEAADPETAVLLFDVVLGDGAHPDPAGELAPALVRARTLAEADGRRLELIAVVVGTDEDPQDLAAQIEKLGAAGVRVETSNEAAVRRAGEIMLALGPATDLPLVSSAATASPLAVINVGLESFATSLTEQGVTVVNVDWRPPAGGNEKLMGILARMKAQPTN